MQVSVSLFIRPQLESPAENQDLVFETVIQFEQFR